MSNEVLFTLSTMTDADIIAQANGKEVLNAKDYNLKGRNADERAISGGLFDPAIFGKVKVCTCGFTRSKDSTSPPKVCPHCKTIVFSNGEEWRRNSAFFRLTIPVIFPYKIEKFWGVLKKDGLEPIKPENLRGNTGTWQAKLMLLWNTAYHVEKTDEVKDQLLKDSSGDKYKLVKTEVNDYTPFQEIGLIGLYNLQSYELIGGGPIDFSQYLNTVIPVTSTYFRDEVPTKRNGQTTLELGQRTILYRAIIEYTKQMPTTISGFASSSIDMATIYHNLNMLVANMMNSSELLGGGKFHTVRDNMRTRVTRSGRANIVPALDLDMDHVYIPRSLAYEALNGDVINRLAEIMDYSEAKEEVRNHTERAEKVFRELVDESMVILLRNPTLHKYNLMAFHPVLTDDPAIGIPIRKSVA